MYFYIMSFWFMLISIFLFFFCFFTLMEEKIFVLEWNLINFDSLVEMKVYMYFDFLANLFLLIISLISMSTFFYSKFYMNNDKKMIFFLFLTFMFIFCMFIMVLSMNYIMILIGWDGLGIISYFLVIHYYSDVSLFSGMVTVMTNRLGDVGMIFGLFLVFDLYCLEFFEVNELGVKSKMIFLFLSLAAFTKSAQYPFSVWLPLAMAAPTPISALVHSSTLVTAGVYLLIRLSFMFKVNSLEVLNLLCLSGLTLLVSGFSALVEVDIKKIIAFSTLSQLSLMMIVLIMGEEILSFYHIITHALFKAMLFLCSGVFIHEYFDNQDIRFYPKIMKINIFVVCIFFICSFSLMGFPFLSGFYSKDLILEFIYSMNFNLFFVFLILSSVLITSLYSFRLMYYSLMLGAKSLNFIFKKDWDSFYLSFFFIFLGVLMAGSALNWLILDKLYVVYLVKKVKLMNFFFIFLGVVCFINIKFYLFPKILSFMFMMFFMLSFQGFICNKCFEKFTFFFNHSEYYLEMVCFYKANLMLKYFNNLLFLFKFIYFYLGFIFILLMYMLV